VTIVEASRDITNAATLSRIILKGWRIFLSKKKGLFW